MTKPAKRSTARATAGVVQRAEPVLANPWRLDMPAKVALNSYAELSIRGGLKVDGEFVDNPLKVIGTKPLSTRRTWPRRRATARRRYGTAVCWQLAAAGITALSTRSARRAATRTRIWWLREQYYKTNQKGETVEADGHEYLAISSPGVAEDRPARDDLFDHPDTVLVDYWYWGMGYDGTTRASP